MIPKLNIYNEDKQIISFNSFDKMEKDHIRFWAKQDPIFILHNLKILSLKAYGFNSEKELIPNEKLIKFH